MTDFDPYKYFAGKMGLLFEKLLYVSDITAEDLAKRSGVSISTVQKIIKGTQFSRRSTYEKMANVFGTSVQELYEAIIHLGDNLDDSMATIIAFGLISDPATRLELAKILQYMATHPGTKKEDIIRLSTIH